MCLLCLRTERGHITHRRPISIIMPKRSQNPSPLTCQGQSQRYSHSPVIKQGSLCRRKQADNDNTRVANNERVTTNYLAGRVRVR